MNMDRSQHQVKEEVDTFGESLFYTLNDCFQQDPEIDEYAFVVSAKPSIWDLEDLKGGASVVFKKNAKDESELDLERQFPFYLRDHKLGLAFWAIPTLYKYAYRRFRQLNQELRRTEEASHKFDEELVKSMLTVTRTILLINPECYTAWNSRKKIVVAGLRSEEAEVILIGMIFTKHPKSVESWAHRRWSLSRLLSPASSSFSPPPTERDRIINREIETVERVARAYPKNYYAWTHRQWVASHLKVSELEQELQRMNGWTRRQISDHAGLHYRQVLLIRFIHLLSPNPSPSPSPATSSSPSGLQQLSSILKEEFDFTRGLISDFPGHEALWAHRRFLIYHWLFLSFQSPSLFFRRLLEEELDFARECGEDDQVSNYQAQRTFAIRYKLWLSQFKSSLSAYLSSSPTSHSSTGEVSLLSTTELSVSRLPEVLQREIVLPLRPPPLI